MADTYKPGDAADFDRLYRATYPRLLRTVALVLGSVDEADDCVQEAYCNAFRAWARWRPEAPADAWLWRIAINTAHSHVRRRRMRSIGEVLRRFGRPADTSADPETIVADRALAAALRSLPTREAAAVVMRHLYDLPKADIAAALGVDLRSVSRILGRGTDRLRALLEEARDE